MDPCAPSPGTNRERIILAIADKAFHDLYASIPFSGETVEVCTPPQAPACLKNPNALLVLLDSGSEPVAGLRLLREVKRLRPDAPVVFITEEKTFEVAVKALRNGSRDVIGKPLQLVELRMSVSHLLRIGGQSGERRAPVLLDPVDNHDSMNHLKKQMPTFILRAVRYMENHLSAKITLEELAREAHLSKYHFCRQFFRHTGMTPLRFCTLLRMQRAKSLLASEDFTISMVAAEVGFNDLGSFIRQFRSHTAMTPSDYRHLLQKGEVAVGKALA